MLIINEWLLDIGEGKIGVGEDGVYDIDIPNELLLPPSNDPICSVVDAIYKDLAHNLANGEYFTSRAILAPTHELVDQINEHVFFTSR